MQASSRLAQLTKFCSFCLVLLLLCATNPENKNTSGLTISSKIAQVLELAAPGLLKAKKANILLLSYFQVHATFYIFFGSLESF